MDMARQSALCHLPLCTATCKRWKVSQGEVCPGCLCPWGDFEFVLLVLGRNKYKIAGDIRPGPAG